MTDGSKKVDALIESLRRDGVVSEEQVFQLDRAKAQEMMQQLQLPDPYAFVLALVQALVARGATRIDCRVDADDVELLAPGATFDREDFEQLYGALFVQGEREELRARRLLSLGVNAALGLRPRWVRVTSGDGARGLQLELRPDRDDEIRALEPKVPGTLVHVKHRLRPGLASRFVKNLATRLPEEMLLKERCRYASIDIVLEGKVISRGLRPEDVVAPLALAGPGYRGFVGVALDPAPPSEVRLVQNGVHIATRTIASRSPRCIAVVDAPALKKDLSQSDIVQDEAHAAVIDAVRESFPDALGALIQQLEERPAALHPRLVDTLGMLRVHVRRFVNRAALHAKKVHTIARHLERAPVIQLSGGTCFGEGPLEDLCCFAPWDLIGVGWDGLVVRYRGAGWHSLDRITTMDLKGAWGIGSQDVHIVGDEGTILHFDGTALTQRSPCTDEDLVAVHGTASNHLCAVGQMGEVLRFNGAVWHIEDVGEAPWLEDVWCHGSGEVFAAGSDGAVLHYDGRRWKLMSTGSDRWLRGVWGVTPHDVFVVGEKGTILHFDGTRWEPMESGTNKALAGVWGRSATDVYAVGRDRILHYDGEQWAPHSKKASHWHFLVAGVTPVDVVASGISSGAVLRDDGTPFVGPHVSVRQLLEQADRSARVLYVSQPLAQELYDDPIPERIARRAAPLLELLDDEELEYFKELLGRRLVCVNQYL